MRDIEEAVSDLINALPDEPRTLSDLHAMAHKHRRRTGVLMAAAVVLGLCLIGAAVLFRTPKKGINIQVVGAPTPSFSKGPTLTPATSHSYLAPVRPECEPSDLMVAPDSQLQGESGAERAEILITNTGPGICSITAISYVRLEDVTGTVLASNLPIHLGVPVTLPPSHEAMAALAIIWNNWCASYPGPVHLSIGLLTGELVAPFGGSTGSGLVPRCDQPGMPSTVGVGSFQGL